MEVIIFPLEKIILIVSDGSEFICSARMKYIITSGGANKAGPGSEFAVLDATL